jgi:hypothetical protein
MDFTPARTAHEAGRRFAAPHQKIASRPESANTGKVDLSFYSNNARKSCQNQVGATLS